MPNEINQDQPQNPQPEPTADEMAAALSFATRLLEGMLPKAQPESPQALEMGPPSEEIPQPEVEPTKEKTSPDLSDLEAKIDEKLEEIKTGLENTIRDEIGKLKEPKKDE